jgi:ABC-type Na+ efflux pump permease subunit
MNSVNDFIRGKAAPVVAVLLVGAVIWLATFGHVTEAVTATVAMANAVVLWLFARGQD